jgi:hypothetical protein
MTSMKQLQQELLAEAKQGMLTSEGAEDLEADDIGIVANVIIASIVGGPWAVLDEWGYGSLMDPNNPALEDYKSSGMWNPARRDNKIRSRPKQPGQTDIFGNSVDGRGKGGHDLEADGKVQPQPPSHALQTASRWMANGRMKEVIQNTIKTFPFGRFFIVDKK